MGNNINGENFNGNNLYNSSSSTRNNNTGFNLSNLFDLRKLGNMFNGQMSNNPFAGFSRMFGGNNRNRGYRSNVRILPIEEAYRVIKSGNCFLLDVRTEMEYSTIRIKGSVNIPLDKLEKEITSIVSDKSELIIVYCATGARVRRAIQILWSLGYNNVCIWEGAGINTFAFADLIVYSDRKNTDINCN